LSLMGRQELALVRPFEREKQHGVLLPFFSFESPPP